MYVNESTAREFSEKGIFLGKTSPCAEAKFSWWEVFSYNNRIVAVCMDPSYGICCGEEITLDELKLYTD